jgi:hypothetical protein
MAKICLPLPTNLPARPPMKAFVLFIALMLLGMAAPASAEEHRSAVVTNPDCHSARCVQSGGLPYISQRGHRPGKFPALKVANAFAQKTSTLMPDVRHLIA